MRQLHIIIILLMSLNVNAQSELPKVYDCQGRDFSIQYSKEELPKGIYFKDGEKFILAANQKNYKAIETSHTHRCEFVDKKGNECKVKAPYGKYCYSHGEHKKSQLDEWDFIKTSINWAQTMMIVRGIY